MRCPMSTTKILLGFCSLALFCAVSRAQADDGLQVLKHCNDLPQSSLLRNIDQALQARMKLLDEAQTNLDRVNGLSQSTDSSTNSSGGTSQKDAFCKQAQMSQLNVEVVSNKVRPQLAKAISSVESLGFTNRRCGQQLTETRRNIDAASSSTDPQAKLRAACGLWWVTKHPTGF